MAVTDEPLHGQLMINKVAREGLVSCLVIGFFAGWTKLHFGYDVVIGVWDFYSHRALYQYSFPSPHGFSSISTQLFCFTIIFGVLALTILFWQQTSHFLSRLLALIAALSVIASLVYSSLAFHQKRHHVQGAKQLIERLESKDVLNQHDERFLKYYKTGLELYQKNNGITP